MEFGVCQGCGNEDYVNESNYCQTCSQNMEAEQRGDEQRMGMCSNCSNETYVDQAGLCNTCADQSSGATFDTEGACSSCGQETYVNDQSFCAQCFGNQ